MNARPSAFAISSPREHFAALGLAAMVTLSLLASVGGVADQQYESALVAQAPASTQMAGQPLPVQRA
ncbi:MAG TPA: hypothetical protein VGQ91_01470 [Ideonella sp.]|jgi:hypothetical protein|nr:hypothetical protein [Ideonella sp.]